MTVRTTSQAPAFAWLNGSIVPFDECKLHVRTQAVFWGANVFEGVRGYWREQDQQLSLFRLDDHLQRLHRSMKSLYMPEAYTNEEIKEACLEVLRINEFRQNVHLCVMSYFGMGPNYDLGKHTEDTGMHITAMPSPRSQAYKDGLAVSISSWRRISDDSMPPRIKTGANYHNSLLAYHEALRNGFDYTFLLNQRGTLSEAPDSCLVMIRDGELVTPPGTSGVLEGITLATLSDLAREHLGMTIVRREIDRTELYVADELFVCGTLREIQPVVSIDHLPVGKGVPGLLTRKLQELYERVVHADTADRKWSTPVPRFEAAPQFGRESNTRGSKKDADQLTVLENLVISLHEGHIEIIDLTTPLSERTPVINLPPEYGQPWPFEREVISRYDAAGPLTYWNNIRLSEHTGTHFDAPVHWLSGKELSDISQVPPQRLVASAAVLDFSSEAEANPDFLLQREHIEAWVTKHGPLPEQGWLLYRTGWDSRRTNPERFLNGGHTPGVAPECARWLAQETSLIGIGVETVGTDAGSAASFRDQPYPCHWYFQGANKYGLTQLQNLAKLPPQGALLLTCPLPIVGGSGSPARVLAFVERSKERQ